MYTLLEQEVVPEFYDRSNNGMPSRWLERIRQSMARLTPEFSAGRTIQNYTEDHYLPAAAGYGQRAAKDSALGVELLQRQQYIAQQWNTVRFGTMQAETLDGQHFLRVQVLPGTLSITDLKVELYANPTEEGEPAIATMTACDLCKEPNGTLTFSVHVSALRALRDYTPRIVADSPATSVPLEAGPMLWQR